MLMCVEEDKIWQHAHTCVWMITFTLLLKNNFRFHTKSPHVTAPSNQTSNRFGHPLSTLFPILLFCWSSLFLNLWPVALISISTFIAVFSLELNWRIGDGVLKPQRLAVSLQAHAVSAPGCVWPNETAHLTLTLSLSLLFEPDSYMRDSSGEQGERWETAHPSSCCGCPGNQPKPPPTDWCGITNATWTTCSVRNTPSLKAASTHICLKTCHLPEF